MYSSLLFSGSLLSLPPVYPMVFLCGRGARWGGMSPALPQIVCCSGNVLPGTCPQHPCALCSAVSRVPCVTLRSGLRVWLPWAAGEGTELCPLAWLLQHAQGSCLHFPVSCVTCEVPALPQQKSQDCGWIWAANCCRPGVWGWTWTQLFTQHGLGVCYLLSSVGHQSLQLCPVCGLVSALESCGGLRRGALLLPAATAETHPPSEFTVSFSFSHHFLLFAKSIKGIQHITVIFSFILYNNSAFRD